MIIKSISYSESREYNYEEGLRGWKRAGIEADLEDIDDIEDAWEKAKKMVQDGLRNNTSYAKKTGKPPAVEMNFDGSVQEMYNQACELNAVVLKDNIERTYPGIQYTGTKNLKKDNNAIQP